jgi:vacuolar-type H+-ATPase subunit H
MPSGGDPFQERPSAETVPDPSPLLRGVRFFARQVRNSMTDNQMRDRVTMLLRSVPTENQTLHPAAPGPQVMPSNDALQVLTLAQRTAEEHVAAARREAEQIRAGARVAAEQTARDAGEHAQAVRAQADQVLAEARMMADQTAHDARTRANEIRQEADQVLSEARAHAETIVGAGREQATQLSVQARYRYEDAVGGLESKREALQQQIEALESFDGEYRQRLTAFLQGQLRALWAEKPEPVEPPAEILPVAPGGPITLNAADRLAVLPPAAPRTANDAA